MKRTEKFSTKVRLTAYLSLLIFSVALLEIGSRLIFNDLSLEFNLYEGYSAEERDTSLPFSFERNGSECVKINLEGMQWEQWWGQSSKVLDSSCVENLFSKYDLSIVFMGGSAMANYEAPNYLTSLDYLTIKNLDNVASINLAESAARHRNMLSRFERQVLPLMPDIVIFLDGFNEFNSIRYGGEPGYDFYWTAGVKDRIHRPSLFFIDKIIEVSSFAELALVRTGLRKSARTGAALYRNDYVIEEASYYLNDITITETICHKYKIECFFVIQPIIYFSSTEENLALIQNASKKFPIDEIIYKTGYQMVLENCLNCKDASRLLNDVAGAFIDPVHFTKHGGEVLSKFILKIINESESYKNL